MFNKSKHVRVLTDFGFKKMFGEENKQFFISLINAILPPGEVVITDITYFNTEMLGDNPNEKKMIFDSYCKTSDDRHVIVELQLGNQAYYGERAVTYISRIISREAKRGVKAYEIPTIYSINLINFKLPIFNNPDEFFWKIQMKNQYNEIFLPKIKLFFIELCTFARLFKEKELSTDLQRWLFIINNMGSETLQDCPFEDPLFHNFFEQGQIEKLTPMEKEVYEKSIYDYQDVQDTIEFERESARTEGRAEGELQAKLSIAKNMIQKGIDLDTIITITNLSAEEIAS